MGASGAEAHERTLLAGHAGWARAGGRTAGLGPHWYWARAGWACATVGHALAAGGVLLLGAWARALRGAAAPPLRAKA